ncbi:IS66 family insertion sequence element accessory protein TnpB [Tenacibaculum maritimum]|uniref:IS66 family insertion sequence element accessory protein TnpB n=1 Tax=Tenacibaculum maritimum TaxID=107401 RepID=UPI0012E46FB5|nr:IS66 family insertion sequence element accessory protein TnpB [Tenacibaculum maritimum]CAA0241759.1 Transposase IS66 family, Accessory Gene [Tenacibaculum maritimum]
MFGLGINDRFYLYHKPCDMRKSFNGLCGLVEKDLLSSPTDGSVYIFINKARDKVKLLHWQSGGFILYYKRLEQGRFELPLYDANVGSIGLDYSQLVLLIDGVSITNLHRRKRYKVLG